MGKDSYHSIAASATGEFKDRGSRFIAYAWPVGDEEQALAHLADLRKEHFKAAHHCFAWRIGPEGERWRANDDGEPFGSAGRPILGQIDAAGLSDVCVIVARYFGGTLLGVPGLINAYREATAEALRQAPRVERILTKAFVVNATYGLVPDLTHALHALGLHASDERYDEQGCTLTLHIRLSEYERKLLQLKAALYKTGTEEALTLDWPAGMQCKAL